MSRDVYVSLCLRWRLGHSVVTNESQCARFSSLETSSIELKLDNIIQLCVIRSKFQMFKTKLR